MNRKMVVGVTAAFLLAGCAGQTTSPVKVVPTTVPSSAIPETPSASSTLLLGSQYKYPDRVVVSVGPPKVYTSEFLTADVVAGKHAVEFPVTIINNSGQAFDASMGQASVQSGNQEGVEVYADAHGILDGPPKTPILHGRSVTYQAAFAVLNPKDVVVQYQPDSGHPPVVFTSK
jgi:hypothetical protein